ncbi:MAG: HDOD domain-containing protein [Thermodesulfobacteriota bacterium]
MDITQDNRLSASVTGFIDRMPSLSTTVTKVLEICNRPNTSPNDLNRVISLDPVLTGQVLKLINSAYYSLPNQITSLGRAIIMLGINTVKNLALSTAILGTLSKTKTLIPMDVFWSHCLCVGVTAKALAAFHKIPAALQEEYFVAGLLHDIGKIPLHNCFPEEYETVLSLTGLEQGPLYRSEELLLGCTHQETGRLIAEKWQFSPTIGDCISCHHAPRRAGEARRGTVAIVALANIYACLHDYGSAGDPFPATADINEALDIAGFRWEDLRPLAQRVDSELEKAKIFLQVSEVSS